VRRREDVHITVAVEIGRVNRLSAVGVGGKDLLWAEILTMCACEYKAKQENKDFV
jgi:hypothetical protein